MRTQLVIENIIFPIELDRILNNVRKKICGSNVARVVWYGSGYWLSEVVATTEVRGVTHIGSLLCWNLDLGLRFHVVLLNHCFLVNIRSKYKRYHSSNILWVNRNVKVVWTKWHAHYSKLLNIKGSIRLLSNMIWLFELNFLRPEFLRAN